MRDGSLPTEVAPGSRPTGPRRVGPVECFQVTGGTSLRGRVRVTGAKNSALKLMAAALLAPGRTTLDEVPDILDVHIMSEVLRRLGCGVAREPEIADLCAMLSAMGARIDGAGTSTITVEGVDGLAPVQHTTIPDRIV